MSGEPNDVVLTRAQVREVDRISIEGYGIPGIVLMENAARAVVDVAMDMLRESPVEEPKVAVVCGGGNNGGDGLAVARHLHNRGVAVWIALTTDPAKYRGDAAINWQIVERMRLQCTRSDDANLAFYLHNSWLIIDALFGTGLEEPPRETGLIEMINDADAKTLAVDVPSGLNCDTGEPLGDSCIRATRTVTFVASKAGFNNPAAKQYLGEVTVGDIGCPREVIARVVADHAAGG